jgi:hypothetical protein
MEGKWNEKEKEEKMGIWKRQLSMAVYKDKVSESKS